MKRLQFLRYSTLLLMLLLFLYLSGCCFGDQAGSNNSTPEKPPIPGENTFSDKQTAAEKGLETFAKLVDTENFNELGFGSAEEARSATLGTPLQVFLVGLEPLRYYVPGSDPNALLRDVHHWTYPVMVKNQIRSSITVAQQDGKWSAVRFGDAPLSKEIGQILSKRVAVPPAPVDDQTILVHIAFLNAYFIGQKSEGKLMLTNVTPLSVPGFEKTVTMPAEEVFEILIPIAKETEDLPT